jgi:hypothetical protein
MTVQWSPAWPVNVGHAFVKWKSPLRGEDADNDGASASGAVAVMPGAVALGVVGAFGPSAHAMAATSATAQRHPTTRWIGRQIVNFIYSHSFDWRRIWLLGLGGQLHLRVHPRDGHTSAESATTGKP